MPNRAYRALAVVDVVESVRLMAAHEDDVIERWRAFVNAVRTELLPVWSGRLVKSLGDGLLLEFHDPSHAVGAGLSLLERIEPLNRARSPEERLDLRIGLHGAHVVQDDLDVYGSGVNLCARLAGLAGPGQIVLSESFRAALCDGDGAAPAPLPGGVSLEDLGWCYLKHIDEPVHAHRVRRRALDGARVQVRPRAAQSAPPGVREAAPAWTVPMPTVAVLSFEADSPEGDGRVIGELLADAIQARLAVSPGLQVVSRWSARALVIDEAVASQAASLLGAQYLVRGRVHSLGGRHVASVEFLDTALNRPTWAGRQAFGIEDLLQSDDEVSMALARQLTSLIATSEVRRAMTSSLPTLDGNALQFSASSLMHQADHAAFSRAQALLEHLIDRFPRQPSPRAWAAMWYVLQVTRGIEHDPTRVADRALDHVHRALDHDPDCSLALAMAGFVHCHLRRDLEAAELCLAKSVEMNPSEAWGWLFRSVVAGHRGQAQPCWEWASRAAALSPLDPQKHYFDALRTSAAVAAGRYAEAVDLARRALSRNADHLPTLRGLAIAQVSLGDLEGARQTGRDILRADPGFNLSAYLAAAPAEGVETRRRYVESLRQAGLN